MGEDASGIMEYANYGLSGYFQPTKKWVPSANGWTSTPVFLAGIDGSGWQDGWTADKGDKLSALGYDVEILDVMPIYDSRKKRWHHVEVRCG
jgi:hypothetical protein